MENASGALDCVRTMSVEYRPRFVCCRADREKGVRECTQRPHPRLSPCEASTPPAARGTAYNTPAGRPRHSEQHPPLFSRPNEPLAPPKISPPKISAEKVSDFTEILFLLVRHYLWNILRTILESSSGLTHPSKGYLQVGCWPHTSFGSKGKKEEVSESLFCESPQTSLRL